MSSVYYMYMHSLSVLPAQDDPKLEDYNVPQRVSDFIKVCQDQVRNATRGHDRSAHKEKKNLLNKIFFL